MIILMVWLYITAFVLLGGEINAMMQAREKRTTENQTESAAIAQRRLAPTTDRELRVRAHRGEAHIEGIRRTGTVDAPSATGVDAHEPPGRDPGIGRGAAVATAEALIGAVTVRSINSVLRDQNGHH